MGFAFLGCRDVKVAKLTADPEGDDPTYGTLKDVDGIQDFNVEPQGANVVSYGDDVAKDVFNRPTSVQVDIVSGRLSLDAQAIVEGGTYTPAAGDVEDDVYEVTGDTRTEAFGLIGQGYLEGVGDVVFIFPKLTCTSLPKIATGYGKVVASSWGALGVPRAADKLLYRIKKRAEVAAIDASLLTE